MTRAANDIADSKIAIIGLGYVGLPLLLEFGKKYPCTGFDVKLSRVEELRQCHDSTREMTEEELRAAPRVQYTSRLEDLRDSNVFIVDAKVLVDVYDPWVEKDYAESEFGLPLIEEPAANTNNAIVIAVTHEQFREMGIDKIKSFGKHNSLVFDVKYLFKDEPEIHYL